jgi:putative intracellular protease/amidase/uncharacterized protein (DUF952 family)
MTMRWLFHVVRESELAFGRDGRFAPPSLAREGFIHASYRDAVRESARLYIEPNARARVLAIDPRRLDVPVRIVQTPRGPMPHVHGPLPVDAIRILPLDGIEEHPDRVTGTQVGFCAFAGMTLLDLVGPLDALSRIASMGLEPRTKCEVFALTRAEEEDRVLDVEVWRGSGLSASAGRYRPALDHFDVLVVPGGAGAATLAEDRSVAAYLGSYPENRILASVCTGALLLGAAGRLENRRATTHAAALDKLARYGARPVQARVVDEGPIVTAAGVTAGIDLGIHLVRRLEGDIAAAAIARQMEITR